MACKGCGARGAAIVTGAKALVRGEIKVAAERTRFVVKSATTDMAAAFRAKAGVARARLARR
jgi:hypothetical protein